MPKKIDFELIRVAARLSIAGLSLKEISNFLDVVPSTVHSWRSHPAWEAELELATEQKHNFVMRNDLITNKLRFFYEKIEENTKIYEKSTKILLIELFRRLSDGNADFKELRSLMAVLKDADMLLRENINFVFELDDITSYINKERGG